MGATDTLNIELTPDQKEVYKEAMLSIKKYKQAAIHLVTGGGKTCILLKILQSLKEKSKTKSLNVLYISTLQSCVNFKHNTSDEYWNNTFSLISYNRLSTEERHIDARGITKANIIVLDEAHHALATRTYIGVKYILDKFPSAIVIAMSANSRRHSDNKLVFDTLTPKLTLGVDYNNRGLKYAIDNDKLCNFEYKNYNLIPLLNYQKLLDLCRKRGCKTEYTDGIANKLSSFLRECNSNIFLKLCKQLQSDMKAAKIDGTQGDRWFIFFNYVDELQESIDDIRELFTNAYNNPAITINIFEYHNACEDVQGAIEALTQPAKENTADIILTCLKGGESFHPSNTRGIIMYRKTKSNTNFTQMLGRTLEIKEMCSGCKLVYDLVGNWEDFEKSEANSGVGVVGKWDFSVLHEISRIRSYINKGAYIPKVDKAYEQLGEFSVIQDDELSDLIEQSEDDITAIECLMKAQLIGEIVKDGEEKYTELGKAIPHPLIILQSFDEANPGFNLVKTFRSLQDLFVQGYFGEYTMDSKDRNNDFFKIYESLGDRLYMTKDCIGEAYWDVNSKGIREHVKLSDLQEIAEEVKSYNYNYNTSICHTKKLNSKISRLRLLTLEGKLSESYQKYCIRNKIDINGLYTSLISVVTKLGEENGKNVLVKQFKSIVRQLNTVETLMVRESLESADNILCMKAIADYQIFKCFYGQSDYEKQCVIALRIRYKDALKFGRGIIGKDQYTLASMDIQSIRLYKLGNRQNNAPISGDKEKAIMELAKRSENGSIEQYEGIVLDDLGVREFRGRRDKHIKELLDSTAFGIEYNNFLQNGSKQSYEKLLTYNIDEMPSYCRDLLNKRKYKSGIKEVNRGQLLLKDNEEIHNIVKSLIYPDTDQINTLKKLIKQNEFDTRNLVKYAMSDALYEINKPTLNLAIANDWNALNSCSRNKIIRIIQSDASAFGFIAIVRNLYEAELIPDEQIGFVQSILN